MPGENDKTNRPDPRNPTEPEGGRTQDADLDKQRAARKENEKAAEGDRSEKTPNPGHPV